MVVCFNISIYSANRENGRRHTDITKQNIDCAFLGTSLFDDNLQTEKNG